MEVEQEKQASVNQKPMKTQRKRNREQQDKKLSISITPEQYRGMNYLGNYASTKEIRQYSDPRLRYLDSEYFMNKKVLDIGCGEGTLALEVAIRKFPAKIVALDIDSKMLVKAKRSADRFVEMNQKFESIKKNELAIMTLQDLPLYFKQKLEKSENKFDVRACNTLQIIPQQLEIQVEFPNNFFLLNDNFFTLNQSQKYQTVLCLGLTKWVHLSFGDEGITILFEKIHDILENDGLLILEYPLMPSYRKKRNLHKLFRTNLDQNIQIQPQQFPDILECLGLKLIKQIQPSPEHPLKHPLAIFRKSTITD